MFGRMILIALVLFSGWANAGLVDKRTKPGQAIVEANYKQVAIEDLTLGLVPADYRVEFMPNNLRNLKATAIGKGPWDSLLTDAITPLSLQVVIDADKKIVKVIQHEAESVLNQNKVILKTTLAQTDAAVPQKMIFETKSRDGLISTTIANWAQKANMQLVWEPEDVDYPVQAENAWGSDIRTAIHGLFSSLAGARTPLRACIHPNQPREVLRIIRAGDACTSGEN